MMMNYHQIFLLCSSIKEEQFDFLFSSLRPSENFVKEKNGSIGPKDLPPPVSPSAPSKYISSLESATQVQSVKTRGDFSGIGTYHEDFFPK